MSIKTLVPLTSVLVMFLAGCANTPVGSSPEGHLRLNESLTIPPESASVRLQYGRVVASNAVQEHDAFCIFELNTRAEVAQQVASGRFAITRVARSVETLAGLPAWRPMRVALGDDGGGPTHIYYKTTFSLAGVGEPARSLTCMSNQNAPGIPIMRHLTLAEIRQALGTLFTLELTVR